VHTLETDGLYITRKRKKWKFAHFESYKNCFFYERGDDPQGAKDALKNYLPTENKKTVLEIAAGNAQFSLELARRYPELNFIAIDIKSDRLYTSAKKALEEGVANIAFVRMHLAELTKLFEQNTVDEIWLTFPDPFPRDRSAKHRLSHPSFLCQYRNILTNTGALKFKTDNRDLFLWSLEQLVAEKWRIDELSFDLHESDLSDDYKIMTHYEEKFTKEGIPTNYATCSVPTPDIA
jgi:tRNA (guanine-N7-)-methyltransferase